MGRNTTGTRPDTTPSGPPPNRSGARKRPTPPKLARGQGSTFYDERDGRCVLEHRVKVDGVTRTFRERGESWLEVEEMRDARRAELARIDGLAGDGTATVVEAFEAWLELEAPIGRDGKPVAPGTLNNAADSLRTLRASAIAETLLVDLRVRDVEAVWVTLAKRARRPLCRSSLAKIRSHLSRAVERAVRLELVETNVVRSSRLPATAAPRRRAVWLDRAGFVAVREELAGDDASNYDRALLVSLLTGCRPGEALGLRWSAVDLEARTITVRSGLQVEENGRTRKVVDELKTTSSRRLLELPADLVRALELERAEQRVRRIAATDYADPTLVFASDTGRPLNPSNLRRAARRVCGELGVPVVTPNQLRHTFASVALDLGFPIPAVARAMGHSDGRMVSTTYGHSLDDVVPTGAALDALAVHSAVV